MKPLSAGVGDDGAAESVTRETKECASERDRWSGFVFLVVVVGRGWLETCWARQQYIAKSLTSRGIVLSWNQKLYGSRCI